MRILGINIPNELGEELTKTHGHYHQKSPDGLDYPEVYQVIKGRAVFVLQKKLSSGMVDVIIIDAKEGDPVLLPPGYGHVTVNKLDRDLILSNLVYDKFESRYDEYKENQGAACYILKGGETQKNLNYMISNIERVNATDLNAKYGFSSKNILEDFVKTPEKFEFLIKPRKLFKN
jgi:glucose-6-phosphate isomerase